MTSFFFSISSEIYLFYFLKLGGYDICASTIKSTSTVSLIFGNVWNKRSTPLSPLCKCKTKK